MISPIKKYHVVEGFGRLEFEKNVAEYLLSGFEPHGGLIVIQTDYGGNYYQAMILRKTFTEMGNEEKLAIQIGTPLEERSKRFNGHE